MRTLEQIAASVSMDTNRFQSMLELYKTTPDFFGGDLAAALEEARQNESLLIPVTYSGIVGNIDKIQQCLDGTDYALLDNDQILEHGLMYASTCQIEEALIERLDRFDCIDGYYFRHSTELLTWIKDNISID